MGWERVLDFWFGPLDQSGRADAEHSARWWRKDPAFDQSIRGEFGAEHAALVAGEREGWLDAARSRLAAVIVLDQFSRNMFRGTGRAFAQDAQAQAVAVGGIEREMDREVALDCRGFYYMPLMHSENLALQDRCVGLFEAFRAEVGGDLEKRVANLLDYAVKHREIVRRFGRFPHRNALLGRESTEVETAFLAQPGSSF